jgi:polysaccharide export outer membrane protein
MKQTVLFLLMTIVAVINTSALAGPQTPAAPVNQDKDFVIGLEDVLAINVWKDPELSVKDIVVRPDGRISLPLVGDIQADGLTVRQLQDSIAIKLKDYITAPIVTVTVVKIFSQSVSVVGQVLKPGVVSLGAPMTVMELLARAGGLTLDAKSKKIKILRKEQGKTITLPFNYNDIINGTNLNQNILLKNGDVVVVP